tara:strand:+ start:1019 stop:1351 length:333 start_codon:yes stop_codon:yes gene_type:complete
MTPRATTVTELEQMLGKVQHELDNINESSIPQGSLLFWKVALETQIRDIGESKSKIPSDFTQTSDFNENGWLDDVIYVEGQAYRAGYGRPRTFRHRRILRPIPRNEGDSQ